MLAPLALCAAIAAQQGAAHVEEAPRAPEVSDADARIRFLVAAEYDSNAPRLPLDQGGAPPGDGLTRLVIDAIGALRTGDVRWSYDLMAGGKLFITQENERMLVGQAKLGSVFPLGGGWVGQLGGLGKVRAQQVGIRSYATTRGDFFASRAFSPRWRLRGGLYGSTFQIASAPLFSSSTGAAQLGVSWYASDREVLDVSVDGRLRAFPFLPALERVFVDGLPSLASQDFSRVDVPVVARVGLSSQRAIFIDLSYELSLQSSNSFGDSFARHRLVANLATRLPSDVTATLRGSIQLSQYPDGISLGQALILTINDDSQNSLVLALDRPWSEHFTLEARLALYGSELSDDSGNANTGGKIVIPRSVASIGIRAEL
jgi:hypothetical protein